MSSAIQLCVGGLTEQRRHNYADTQPTVNSTPLSRHETLCHLSYSDTFNVNIQRLMPVKGQKIHGLL